LSGHRRPKAPTGTTPGDQQPLQAAPQSVAGPCRPAQPHLAVGLCRRSRARVRLLAPGRTGRGRDPWPQPLGVGLPRCFGAPAQPASTSGLAADRVRGRRGQHRRGVRRPAGLWVVALPGRPDERLGPFWLTPPAKAWPPRPVDAGAVGAGTGADLSHRSSWRGCMRDDW